MRNMIAYCGLDCGKCDAYLATINDDQALREKTANRWAELNDAPILPEHINCEGCRVDGIKTVFCDSLCGIRQCALKKIENGSFYIISHALSNKIKHIKANPVAAIAGEWFTAYGTRYDMEQAAKQCLG